MNNLPIGTPKSLAETINNGVAHGNIEAHIKDFLRQKFAIAFMRAGDNQDMLNMLHSLGAMIGILEKVTIPTTGHEQKLKRVWDAIQDLSKAEGE